MNHWTPASAPSWSELENAPEPPTPGTLIAHNRTLWRVTAIHERHPANWEPTTETRMGYDLDKRDWFRSQPPRKNLHPALAALIAWDGQPETWPNRPRGVEVQPAAGGQRRHLRWPHRDWASWYIVDEHHPVCASCGELYPCREMDAAKQAAREMRRVDELMSVAPGHCWHCQEPITRRQQAREFPGENLLLPGAPPPSFHTRRSGGCWDAAYQYEKRWREADPSRTDAPSVFGGAAWERP